MPTAGWIAAAAILLGLMVMFGRLFLRVYLRLRGDHVITCPENTRPAGVRLDIRHSLLAQIERKRDLRLRSCSRWPEHQDCGQQCLSQIEAAPEECRIRSILSRWYAGKTCALCGRLIGEIQWNDHKPALLSPDHKAIPWQDVPAEEVYDFLATYQPVCWNCHIVHSMLTQHPEMVIDRSRQI